MLKIELYLAATTKHHIITHQRTVSPIHGHTKAAIAVLGLWKSFTASALKLGATMNIFADGK
jgi:hypothetical protein